MKIYETRNDLFNSFDKELIICEIGVFRGDFSKFIYENCIPKELHLIDVFTNIRYRSGDKDGKNFVRINLMKAHIDLLSHFKNNTNVFIHKGKSLDILSNFNNNYFDIIYIDGDHSYNGVKIDLTSSYDKVKNGGLICGHDYKNAPSYEGVFKAVNEFCQEKLLEINYITKDDLPSFAIQLKKS